MFKIQLKMAGSSISLFWLIQLKMRSYISSFKKLEYALNISDKQDKQACKILGIFDSIKHFRYYLKDVFNIIIIIIIIFFFFIIIRIRIWIVKIVTIFKNSLFANFEITLVTPSLCFQIFEIPFQYHQYHHYAY